MPLFDVRFEDVLFADSDACAENELSEREVFGFTETAVKEGLFPAGVFAVVEGHISSVDGVEDGEFKMFASIVLRVEAASIVDAEDFMPPEDVLTRLVDMLTSEKAGQLEGNWEVLETDEVAETAAVPEELSAGLSISRLSDKPSSA